MWVKKSILQIKGFDSSDWYEIRCDIDSSVKPDVIGTLTDTSAIEADSVDAVFSSHNIEHFYPHEVPLALKVIFRILKPNGNLFMAHRCGFTFKVLTGPTIEQGFKTIFGKKRPQELSTLGNGF